MNRRTAVRRSQEGGKPVTLQPVKKSKTVGRNEPCPCGSGKKSKRCHNVVLIPKPPENW